MLFLIDNKKRKFFNRLFKDYIIAPVSFERLGSQVIYNRDNE